MDGLGQVPTPSAATCIAYESMTEQERHNLFVELLTRHQSQLYGYIFALVRNREDAADLFQSVGLVLWRKFESFRPDSSFISWAGQTTRFEVRNFLRRKRRSIYVSEELSDSLVETVHENQSDATESYLAALNRCKGKLSVDDDALLRLHYLEELSTRQIAERMGRPQSSVCHSLARIRRWLFGCIRRELGHQDRTRGETS
jgi:RNA polymerase sigma-70 factor (ECF subfamily)